MLGHKKYNEKGWKLDLALELSVYKLVLNSSIFAKIILLVLLNLSIVSWAIMLQKYFFISTYKSELSRFLKTLTKQANPAHIENSCAHFSSGSAKTMPILLLRLIQTNKGGNLLISPGPIVNNVAMHEANKLTKWMEVLAASANISPLIGLLGTVWGVMYSFINIGQMGSANIAAVAPGIAEALITTIAGLCVAIPAMAGHNVLTGVINECLDFLDRISEYALSVVQ